MEKFFDGLTRTATQLKSTCDSVFQIRLSVNYLSFVNICIDRIHVDLEFIAD